MFLLLGSSADVGTVSIVFTIFFPIFFLLLFIAPLGIWNRLIKIHKDQKNSLQKNREIQLSCTRRTKKN